MRALWALSYADRRAFINGLRALRGRPWRALLWVFWLGAIGFFGWIRTRGPAPHTVPFWQLAIQDAWICGPAIAFGVVVAFGAARHAGFFRSQAEAIVLVRAPLPAPAVAAYLQARAAGLMLAQNFGRFAYLALIAIPGRTSPAGLLRDGALLAAATIAFACVPLPRALARGAWRVACVVAGVVLIVAAAVPLLRDAAIALAGTPFALAFARSLPDVHPGSVLVAVANGDARPVVALLGVALAAVAAFVAGARDAYPELYALSMAQLELRARDIARRTLRTTPAGPRVRRGAARVWLRGAWAIAWLDAVVWSRRAQPLGAAALAACALVCGAAIGFIDRLTGGDTSAVVFPILPNAYVAIASMAGIRLAADLRRPLFWLGGAPLTARLAAWAFAPLWRDAAVIGLVALGYGAIAERGPIAATVLAGGIAIALLCRAAALAIFALIPHALDQRGPAVFLRLLLAYVLVVPAAAAAILTTLAGGSMIAGALAGLAAAVLEGAALTAFAAWRLGGRIDRLATA